MAHMGALMGVQAAGRETLADSSTGRPDPQGARPSIPVASGARRRTGATRRRCGCRSSSCTCITRTCLRPPVQPSLAVPPTCAPCSASTRPRAAGMTSATGRRGPTGQGRDLLRKTTTGWAGPQAGGGV